MQDLDVLLKDVAEDSVSGSSEIYSRLLSGLEKALGSRPTCEQWAVFADALSKVKRSMAPVQNVAGSLRVLLNASIPEEQFNGFVKGFLNGLRERESEAPAIIAKRLGEMHGPSKVVTISYSSTVMAALSAMKGARVAVAESQPLGEGSMTLSRLKGAGTDGYLFRDSMAAHEVEGADLVLVGADAVCPEGLVNKVGTKVLALAAKEAGVPFVAVCSTSKLIPVLEPDAMASVRNVDGLPCREMVFELTPLDLVSTIITEEGAMSGGEMKGRLLSDRKNMKLTECQTC